jgi:hypothetical protein
MTGNELKRFTCRREGMHGLPWRPGLGDLARLRRLRGAHEAKGVQNGSPNMLAKRSV